MNDLNLATLSGIVGGAVTVLVTTVLVITKWEELRALTKKYVAWRRRKFAERQVVHCQAICAAPAYMIKIQQHLVSIDTHIELNRDMNMTFLGERLTEKSEKYCAQGFMPQLAWKDMLKMMFLYDRSLGNGNVFVDVERALKLPEYLGGPVRDIDLASLISAERERFKKEKEMKL
jgi:hypothetical protein